MLGEPLGFDSGLILTGSMHRLTARFLLLFAVVGNFVPLAVASAAEQPHACCLRKAAHPCHGAGRADAIADSSRPDVRDAGCCHHDCCRGVATAQWAHPQSRTANLCGRLVSARAP